MKETLISFAMICISLGVTEAQVSDQNEQDTTDFDYEGKVTVGGHIDTYFGVSLKSWGVS